jgi:uncharacterized iron-regulated membrane protein
VGDALKDTMRAFSSAAGPPEGARPPLGGGGAKRRFRGAFLQVHLWLGLTLGVIGALLGISGCILVYDHEIDAWLHPARYAVSGSGSAFKLADYARIAEKEVGSPSRAGMIRLPDREIGPAIVFVRTEGGFQRVYIDPSDGDVLDRAGNRDLVPWMHNFHESLMLASTGAASSSASSASRC